MDLAKDMPGEKPVWKGLDCRLTWQQFRDSCHLSLQGEKNASRAALTIVSLKRRRPVG
jgi:hypothetical protein